MEATDLILTEHLRGSQNRLGRPEVDLSEVAQALGAELAAIRSLSDLSALQDWIYARAGGTFVVDCRITSSVRALWLIERMKASEAAKATVASRCGYPCRTRD